MLKKYIIVFLISMVPLIELRGGIPLARILMLPLWQAIFFSVLGNIIPIPFILLFIERIFDWMRPTRLFGGIVKKLEARALSKSEGIQRAEFMGLLLFVGIPLPGTGAWTGTLAASILDMKFKESVIAVMLGVVLAGIIMGLVSAGLFGTILGGII